jgi:hypothetical protein
VLLEEESLPYPNYLCVFHADQEVQDDVVDIGHDPDFRPPVPTWGICRPDKRHSVEVGSYIVFLGYYKEDQRYLVKGWIRVGEKINYLEALKRFVNRPNVIIREAPQTKLSTPRSWKQKHKDLQKLTRDLYGTDKPLFLTTINFKNQVYVQFEEDPHEIDNWKCGRMFRCQTKQLQRCIEAGACKRETIFPDLTDYIIAAEGEWQDVGRQLLKWHSVAPPCLRDKSLRTPLNQHNGLLLSDAEVKEVVCALRVFS